MAGTIVTINEGTQTGIANDSVGGTMYQTIKLDIGTTGVSNLFSGTLPAIANLEKGTITKIEGGTVGLVSSIGSVVGVGGTVQVNLVGTEPIVVEVGTISAGTINTGTINAGTFVMTLGTISSITSALDPNNSSTATLAAGGTFTGTATEALGYGAVCVSAISDVASASDGYKVQYSFDGTNWDHSFLNTLPANDEKSITTYIKAKYYRVQYINGGGSQTYFRLNSELKNVAASPTIKELGLSIGTTDSAMITKSLIAGTTTGGGGGIVEVKVTPSGAISADVGTAAGVGTVTTIGTLVGVGVVTNLTSGSVRMTVGTLTTGTLQNLVSGTINSATAVLNSGTINVATAVITTLPNLPQGSINVTQGTITAGSIIVTNGTISHGTIDIGTVKLDGRTARNILSYGTTFGAGGAAYGTLVGSAAVGAGTSLWVNDISITNPAGNITCLVGFGTALTGTSVLLKGTFGTTSAVGIEKGFPLPVNAGMTNQDLVAYISGAGTIDVNISYFISA